ncbi:hypothetical protein G6F56_012592 [Rhizopus delemar]|nr:hypothetical protein G6F56_012592 [Rhizopus delemar]
MCLPRKFGGLGILNPSVQQRALQIRWLIPLLQPTHGPSSPLHALRHSIVLSRLVYFVLLHSCPPSVNPIDWDFRLPFLFPDLRSSLLCQYQLSLSLLFSAIDSLPQNWSHVVINPATVLSLPVMALTLNSVSNVVPKSFRKLRGSNAFITIDGDATLVRARLRSEMTYYPILSKKFLYMVSVSQVDLAPFFLRTFPSTASAALELPDFTPVSHNNVDVTPFVDALFGLPPSGIQVINHPPVSRRPLDSRYYRRLYIAPLLKKQSISISWKSFWSFPIVHSALLVSFVVSPKI